MGNIRLRLFFHVSLILLPIIQSRSSAYGDLVVSDLFYSSYKEYVNDLVSNRLSGTLYCGSLLLPTERTLKQSLEATFVNAKKDMYLEDEKFRVDSCCRSLFKCDAFKHVDMHLTNDWNFSHCECVNLFQTCLQNINTPLSDEVAHIHYINATKCYAKNHPIIKCVKTEETCFLNPQFDRPVLRFANSAERHRIFTRCTKYEFDEKKPQQLQLFDLSFKYYGTSTNETVQSERSIILKERMQELREESGKSYQSKTELMNTMTDVMKYIGSIGCVEVDKFLSESKSIFSGRTHEIRHHLDGVLELVVSLSCKNARLVKTMDEKNDGNSKKSSASENNNVGILTVHIRNPKININNLKIYSNPITNIGHMGAADGQVRIVGNQLREAGNQIREAGNLIKNQMQEIGEGMRRVFEQF